MFSKILGKKKETTSKEDQEKAQLLEKISQMNITEMKAYVNNKIETFPIDEDGLTAVIERLIAINEKTKLYYIKVDDTDSKKKKAFDLVLLASKSKKITFTTVEKIQEFLEIYKDIILEFDTQYKEIYGSRFNDAITLALSNIAIITELKNKMNLLGED